MKKLYLCLMIIFTIFYCTVLSSEAANKLTPKIKEISAPYSQVNENIAENPSSYTEFSFIACTLDNAAGYNNENMGDGRGSMRAQSTSFPCEILSRTDAEFRLFRSRILSGGSVYLYGGISSKCDTPLELRNITVINTPETIKVTDSYV